MGHHLEQPSSYAEAMRLNALELAAIRSTLRGLDPLGHIYLYGSRADDARRGGDIDLFLDASKTIDLKSTLTLQYRLSLQCDTKVDLLIKSPDQVDLPIHKIARQGTLL